MEVIILRKINCLSHEKTKSQSSIPIVFVGFEGETVNQVGFFLSNDLFCSSSDIEGKHQIDTELLFRFVYLAEPWFLRQKDFYLA